jgi:recombination protein RecT
VAFSAIGLDPIQKNHINLIPFKNSSTNKFDINFMMGYRGMELKAKKYGFEAPDDVTVKVVYSNEKFVPIYKDVENETESYIFKPAADPFDRGEIKGGFYYHVFKNAPEKNKLRVFNMADIEKRIPGHASPEFWGGEKPIYKNGQKTNQTEKVEGWKDEMVYKTICRAAYDDITIDSEKIDDHFVKMLMQDEERNNLPEPETAQNIIEKKQANAKEMNFDEAIDVTDKEAVKEIEAKKETVKVPETKQAEAVENKKLDPIVNGDGAAELNFD